VPPQRQGATTDATETVPDADDQVGKASMSLSADDVQWVAHLARLELNDDELATMTRQLSAILEHVDQLKQVNTNDREPLAHPLPLQNIFRDDEPAPSLPVDAALANAPQRHGNFYSVPAVLE